MISEMADLHSHLLPGVDDGSRTPEQSVGVLGAMLSENVTDICLTPHLSVAELVPDRLAAWIERHDKAYNELMAVAPMRPRTYRGSEIMLDQPFPRDAVLTHRVSIAGSRYALIEFPPGFSAQSIRALIKVVVEQGFVPLLAHVERYSVATTDEVYLWRERGAAIQVDATTLAAGRGARTERARAVIRTGLADVIAADNHGDSRTLGPVSKYLHERDGIEQAEYLLRINPQAILKDQAIESVPPLRLARTGLRTWVDFLRRG